MIKVYIGRIIATVLLCLSTHFQMHAQTVAQSGAAQAASSTPQDDVEQGFLQEPAGDQFEIPVAALKFINNDSGIITQAHTGDLINALLTSSQPTTQGRKIADYISTNLPTLATKDPATIAKGPFIIHVVVWHEKSKLEKSDLSSLQPDQRWYVYQDGKLNSGHRLFGVHKFWFLYIHFIPDDISYPVRYDFTISRKQPLNIQHLYEIASLVTTKAATQSGRSPGRAGVWGGQEIDSDFSTSDIAISSKIKSQADAAALETRPSGGPATNGAGATPPTSSGTENGITSTRSNSATPGAPVPLRAPRNGATGGTSASGASTARPAGPTTPRPTSEEESTAAISGRDTGTAAQPSTTAADAAAAQASAPTDALDSPQTFHNEAPMWWDVSVGFPATNTNQLTFISSGAGLIPQQIDKRRMFGLFDLYPFKSQRMQIAKQGYSWIPSVIVGLPLASQPLHKPLAALGWGPPLLQFYWGAVVVKQPDTPVGTNTSGQCTGWCPQMAFGINFSVRSALDHMQGK